ncbi:EamA family transporter [Pendulispora albinea]|uniref:DMT family transporter n=1 Tax=Pendulispora albinea TaxID=2741071 RepID=A0ABZ2LT38_9BACT
MASDSVSLSIVLLVVGSAFLHALWNAILKRQEKPEWAAVGITFVSAASTVALALTTASSPPPMAAILLSVASGVFEAGYFVTLAKALARAPLGVAYTVARGGALLLIWPISVLWLGEKVTATTVCGTALVVCGLILVGWSNERKSAPRPASSPASSMSPASLRAGIGWAMACAVFITGYHLLYKRAMQAQGTPTVVLAVSMLVASTVSVAWHGRATMTTVARYVRAHPWPIVIAGLLTTASFVAFLGALERGGAGIIMTLRNTSVLFAQVLAWLGGERSRPLQIAGTLAVAAGAVCMAWP